MLGLAFTLGVLGAPAGCPADAAPKSVDWWLDRWAEKHPALRGAGGWGEWPVLRVCPDGGFVVAGPDGELDVDPSVFGPRDDGPARAFWRRWQQAQSAGLPLDAPTLGWDPLLGVYLSTDDMIVVREGVLRRVSRAWMDEAVYGRYAAPPERASPDLRRGALEAATRALRAALHERPMSASTRAVLDDLLAAALARAPVPGNDFRPAWARARLSRSAAWRALGVPDPVAQRYRGALDEAMRLHAQASFVGISGRGGTPELTYLADAFGDTATVLRTGRARRFSRAGAVPQWYDETPTPLLVVEVSPFEAATWFVDDRPVARWEASDGFRSDEVAWRAAFGFPGRAVVRGLPDAFPPHLVVTDLGGRVEQLVTPYGRIVPKDHRGGWYSDSDGAYPAPAEMAAALPDAAHLDLLGQYLVEYVHDGPDPDLPWLPGTLAQRGDLHQTSDVTRRTVIDGRMAGDCDDLAELQADILTAQGKLPQVIGVPGHLAVAWAERAGDAWTVSSLTTGPAIARTAPTLGEAVVDIYQEAGQGDWVDPSLLEFTVRYDGAPLRTTVFGTPEWFVDTEVVVAGVERQHAELLGLRARALADLERRPARSPLARMGRADARATAGDWAGAAALYAEVAAVPAVPPATRLRAATARVGMLLRAGRPWVARAEALRVAHDVLPAAERDGAGGHGLLGAVAALGEALLSAPGGAGDAVAHLAALGPSRLRDAARWRFGGAALADLEAFVFTAVSARRLAGASLDRDARDAIDQLLDMLFDGVWFTGVAGPVEWGTRLAAVGSQRVSRARHPAEERARLALLADGAELPGGAPWVHGVEDRAPWIAAEPAFWWNELQLLLDPVAPAPPDDAEVARVAGALRRAQISARSRGADHPLIDYELLADLVERVLTGPPARVAQTWRATVDGGVSGGTAVDTLVDVGRLRPPAAFGAVAAALGQPPGDPSVPLRLAWRALERGLPRHALAAARAADPVVAATEVAALERSVGGDAAPSRAPAPRLAPSAVR